jgi:hypothetical protein
MAECDICMGTRRVSHAVRAPLRNVMVSGPNEGPISADVKVREYPCPECSMRDYVPIERLWTLEEIVAYDPAEQEWGGQEFERHIRRRLAHGMIGPILDAGVLSFQDAPVRHDRFPNTRERRATMSVVPARFTKSLEDRVRERQTVVAERAAVVSTSDINAWGGNTSHIPKTEAIASIREAVKKAVDNFFSWKVSDR